MRGIYPTELNEETAYRIGRAFVQHLGVNQVAVGRDMRVSSPAIAAAIMRGVTEQGADAIDLGLTTTDELYFAVGKYSYPAGVDDYGLAQSGAVQRHQDVPRGSDSHLLRDRRRRHPRHRAGRPVRLASRARARSSSVM